MAGTVYQGTQLIGTATYEDHYLNDTQIYNYSYVHWNWYQPYVQCEPERFARRMSKKFAFTFTEQKTETNAEDFAVHIVYKITK